MALHLFIRYNYRPRFMLDVNTHDATFFFPFINLDAFENLSPENSPTNWQNWAIAPIATKLHVTCDVFAVIAGPRLLNMQNFNLAWIKMHVARVVIPSHGEGKQIVQNMLKVACYYLCATVCSSTETSRKVACYHLWATVGSSTETSRNQQTSVAAQKTVEEAPAMTVLAAIWRLFINEVKHRKTAYLYSNAGSWRPLQASKWPLYFNILM